MSYQWWMLEQSVGWATGSFWQSHLLLCHHHDFMVIDE